MEATKSLFLEALGDSPYLRVLDHFLMFPGWDYSKSQVARDAGISRVTLEPIWRHLLELKFIEKTRTIGRAELCRLNLNSLKVRAINELGMKLADIYAETQQPQKQRIPVKQK